MNAEALYQVVKPMIKSRRLDAIFGSVLCLLCGPELVSALGPDPSSLCDQAARQAASETAVPVAVLLAITRVETGRNAQGQLKPWPWAINLAGEGHWFDDSAEAIAFAADQLAQGHENFDVGCFQINLHWHGAEFVSLDDVFDPQSNARYAAQFLTELYTPEGGWSEAVAAYHSRSPDKAAKYLQKVEMVLADLDAQPRPPVDVGGHARKNRFPLLQKGDKALGASLVPVVQGVAPLFGAQ